MLKPVLGTFTRFKEPLLEQPWVVVGWFYKIVPLLVDIVATATMLN